MTDNAPSYDIAAIRRLLMFVFDDPGLDAFCQEHFLDIYDLFSRGMRMDEKITTVVDHCRRRVDYLDRLLQAVRDINEDLFFKHGPYLVPADQLVSGMVVRTDPFDMVAELTEWKLVHSESQLLLNALRIPLDYLTIYRFNHDPDRLDEAGYKWQELCVRRLRSVPDKWNLQYAYTPVLDDLRAQTSSLDEITRQLMQTDIQRPDFKTVYFQLTELRGILWDILTAADKRITALIEALKPVIGG